MLKKWIAIGSLGLVAALPLAAFADGGDDDGGRRWAARAHLDDGEPWRVWIQAHVETRESRNVIPAATRDEWVPDRCEECVTPAVTDRVFVPAVTERVYRPAVMERRWVAEVRERVLVPGHYETRTDRNGCDYQVWVSAHHEVRVVSAAHFEDRCIREARWETRVVQPERWDVRIVAPERREVRVVESGHWQTVVVRPQRTEVTVERVMVPGHWELSPTHQRS